MQAGSSLYSSFPEAVSSGRDPPSLPNGTWPNLQSCRSLPNNPFLFKITELNNTFSNSSTNDSTTTLPDQSNPLPEHHSTIKRKWTAKEDELLMKAVETYGKKSWSSVSTLVPGRNPKQCRERWTAQINPVLTKQNWTPEEDQLLINLQQIHGNLWAFIALFLPGRSGNSVKNRFNWLERRHLTRSRLSNPINSAPSSNPLPIPEISNSRLSTQTPLDDSGNLDKNYISVSCSNHSESLPLKKTLPIPLINPPSNSMQANNSVASSESEGVFCNSLLQQFPNSPFFLDRINNADDHPNQEPLSEEISSNSDSKHKLNFELSQYNDVWIDSIEEEFSFSPLDL